MSKIKISILLIASTSLFIFANSSDFLSSPVIEQSKYINPEPRQNFNYPPSQSMPYFIFWDTLAPVPDTLYRSAGCCDTSGHCYKIGGQTGTNEIQNTVYKYFADEDSWCEKQPMLYALSNLGAVFHAPTNRIYVFGGYTGTTAVNYTQIYDIAQDSWYLGTPHNLNYLGSYGATIGDTIYVTGSDLSAVSIGIWGYNVNTNEWRFISNLPGGSANGSATAFENKIYFAGGWPSRDTVCEYTTGIGITDSLFCYLPRSSYGHCLEEVQGKLWLFGGALSWPDTWYTVYSYDLDQGPNGNWSNENPLTYQAVGPYGKMFFGDSWRIHAFGFIHLRGTITPPPLIDIALLRINQSSPYTNVKVKNVGISSVSNIPVTIWIDSQSTRIYSQSQTFTGPLNPGDTANVSFPISIIGVPGVMYVLTAFTNVAGDSNQTNDTLRLIIYEKGLIWSELPSAPEVTYACAGCGDTSGHFYVLGGFVNGNRSSNNWLYDEITRTWIIKQNLPFPAANSYAAYDLARNRIFCLGGTSPNNVLQIYYIDGDSWSFGSQPPTTSVGPFEIIGDTLYSFGSKLHRYHIPANSWDSGISIPGYLSFCGICTYDREIYFSGGYPANPSVYKYTLDTNTWTQLPDLPVGRHSHGMEVIDDKIVVFGGGQVWSPLNSVYVLDPHYPQAGWAPESSMIFGQMSAATGVVKINGVTQLHASCGYNSGGINEHEAASFQVTNIEETNSSYITKSLLKVIPTLSKHTFQIKVVNSGNDNGNIMVFNNCGRLIRKFSPILGKGEFTIIWDKTDDKGINVSPGVYFIIFDKRGEKLTEKVIIID
jgi:hypothetical protein